MNRKIGCKLFIVTILSGSLLFAGCSHRYANSWHSHDGDTEKIMTHIVEELELNEQQKAQLEKVVLNINSENKMIERKAFVVELTDQFRKEKVDEAHLNDIISTNINRVDQDLRLLVRNLSDFHGKLTSDQKMKLVALMEKREKRGDRNNNHHK